MRAGRAGGPYSPISALITMANVEAPSANGGLSRQVPTLPYLPALDGLRAIAVAAVIVYHLDTNLAQGGFLGVEVFFVVSGYLITSLLLRELRVRHTVGLRAFWARRARRLLPALVALLVVVGAYVSLFARDVVGVYRGDALASLFYVQNWWQIFGDQSYFDSFGRPSPLRHLWSLAIEEQFYLLWPLLLGAALTRLGRRRSLGLIAVGALASIALMAELADITALDRAYYGTDTRAFGLLVGAALALVWRPGRRLVNRRGATHPWALDVLALGALAALLWQLAGRSEFDPWTFPWGLAWVDGVTLLLIAAAATTGSLVRPRARRGAAGSRRAALLLAVPVALAGDRLPTPRRRHPLDGLAREPAAARPDRRPGRAQLSLRGAAVPRRASTGVVRRPATPAAATAATAPGARLRVRPDPGRGDRGTGSQWRGAGVRGRVGCHGRAGRRPAPGSSDHHRRPGDFHHRSQATGAQDDDNGCLPRQPLPLDRAARRSP